MVSIAVTFHKKKSKGKNAEYRVMIYDCIEFNNMTKQNTNE